MPPDGKKASDAVNKRSKRPTRARTQKQEQNEEDTSPHPPRRMRETHDETEGPQSIGVHLPPRPPALKTKISRKKRRAHPTTETSSS